MTGVLNLASCSTYIHEKDLYAPIPGDQGALSAHFLSDKTQVMTETEWEKMQIKWLIDGNAIVCMSSDTLAYYKQEEEELCSKTNCSYQEVDEPIHTKASRLAWADRGTKQH